MLFVASEPSGTTSGLIMYSNLKVESMVLTITQLVYGRALDCPVWSSSPRRGSSVPVCSPLLSAGLSGPLTVHEGCKGQGVRLISNRVMVHPLRIGSLCIARL